jgi:hypothetical protein
VNDYIRFLIHLFDLLKIEIKEKNRKLEVILSHDVDRCILNSRRDLAHSARGIYQRAVGMRLARFIVCWTRFMRYKIIKENPFNSFDALMGHSEKYGFKNSFYFKACQSNEPGFTYDVRDDFIRETIQKIKERKHFIGFHPSQNTVNDHDQFRMELNRLRQISEDKIIGGRNHFLCYNQDMYRFWEAEDLEYDSGVGFQYYNGFRAGICLPYIFFDIHDRRPLLLVEKPFIAMDTVWLRRNMSPKKYFDEVKSLLDIIISYNGLICLNWHSNLINVPWMRKFRFVYFELVKYIGERTIGNATA